MQTTEKIFTNLPLCIIAESLYMVYNVGMDREKKKIHKKLSFAMHHGLAFMGLAVLLIVSVVLILGFEQTGAVRYARLNPTQEPIITAAPSPSPAPGLQKITPVPIMESPTPEPTQATYTQTRIVIDGQVIAVLASREAAEELINHVIAHFEAQCDAIGLASKISNEIEYLEASDSLKITSYDDAFALLTGEETPITVISRCSEMETTVVQHGVNRVYSDEYYEGTLFISSYGRDGKNMRTLEYTYVNGVLSDTSVLDEGNLYPAVMEVFIVGTKPIPESDTVNGEFDASDCPSLDRGFRQPVNAKIIKYFGFYGGVLHNGIDYDARENASCRASCAGTVRSVMERGAYGLTVDIDHGDGLITRYAGMSSASVSVGDTVSIGDEIGKVGKNGLHFEIILDGRPRNPCVYLLG